MVCVLPIHAIFKNKSHHSSFKCSSSVIPQWFPQELISTCSWIILVCHKLACITFPTKSYQISITTNCYREHSAILAFYCYQDCCHLAANNSTMMTSNPPAYANILMGTLESIIFSETNPSHKHWKRYIDDIFIVWTDTKESLEQSIKNTNFLHPHINFTEEFSTDEITFQDLCL